ncbi:hypothetical protein HDU98_001349 [Podochytrium sp. JEL0797]|nr:hypothetical protein HDU98_001349 [Podochytrium sp. JEL0797]
MELLDGLQDFAKEMVEGGKAIQKVAFFITLYLERNLAKEDFMEHFCEAYDATFPSENILVESENSSGRRAQGSTSVQVRKNFNILKNALENVMVLKLFDVLPLEELRVATENLDAASSKDNEEEVLAIRGELFELILNKSVRKACLRVLNKIFIGRCDGVHGRFKAKAKLSITSCLETFKWLGKYMKAVRDEAIRKCPPECLGNTVDKYFRNASTVVIIEFFRKSKFLTAAEKLKRKAIDEPVLSPVTVKESDADTSPIDHHADDMEVEEEEAGPVTKVSKKSDFAVAKTKPVKVKSESVLQTFKLAGGIVVKHRIPKFLLDILRRVSKTSEEEPIDVDALDLGEATSSEDEAKGRGLHSDELGWQ